MLYSLFTNVAKYSGLVLALFSAFKVSLIDTSAFVWIARLRITSEMKLRTVALLILFKVINSHSIS